MKKNSVGRPPRSGKKPMGGRLEIRLLEGEKANYDRAAELAGAPLSEWIRDILNREAESLLKTRRQSK